MGNIFNEDFRDFLLALRRNDVRYVLVGGYPVIIYINSLINNKLHR